MFLNIMLIPSNATCVCYERRLDVSRRGVLSVTKHDWCEDFACATTFVLYMDNNYRRQLVLEEVMRYQVG
jgi:hypothetical protein